jgi:hypothetical protein
MIEPFNLRNERQNDGFFDVRLPVPRSVALREQPLRARRRTGTLFGRRTARSRTSGWRSSTRTRRCVAASLYDDDAQMPAARPTCSCRLRCRRRRSHSTKRHKTARAKTTRSRILRPPATQRPARGERRRPRPSSRGCSWNPSAWAPRCRRFLEQTDDETIAMPREMREMREIHRPFRPSLQDCRRRSAEAGPGAQGGQGRQAAL